MRIYHLLGVFLVSFILLSSAMAQEIDIPEKDIGKVPGEPSYAKGELLVGFKENVKLDEAESLIKSYGLSVYERFWDIKVLRVGVPEGQEKQFIKRLEQEPIVKYAELNYIVGAEQETPAKGDSQKTYAGIIIGVVGVGIVLFLLAKSNVCKGLTRLLKR